jgi:hypothetical protein
LTSESLNLLEPSGPVQACNGIALFFTSHLDTFVMQTDKKRILFLQLRIWHEIPSTGSRQTQGKDFGEQYGRRFREKCLPEFWINTHIKSYSLAETNLHLWLSSRNRKSKKARHLLR